MIGNAMKAVGKAIGLTGSRRTVSKRASSRRKHSSSVKRRTTKRS